MSLKKVILDIDTVLKNNFDHYFYYKIFIEYSQYIYFYKTTFRDESTYITFIFSNSTQKKLFVVKV